MPDPHSAPDSVCAKADAWLRRLQYVIPRAAYLDLQAAINELAYYAQKEGTEYADH